MALRHCYRMPAISVVRSARSFGRDHWSAQRILRRAACAECGTIRGLLQPLEHLGANTLCRFIRGYSFRPEDAIRIEFGVFLPETQTTLRNSSDPAPFPITYLEHFRQHFLSAQVALVSHCPIILVLDCRPSFFELRHQHQDGFQQIKRLETTHNNRHAELANKVLILAIAHDCTNVPRTNETLHAIAR